MNVLVWKWVFQFESNKVQDKKLNLEIGPLMQGALETELILLYDFVVEKV